MTAPTHGAVLDAETTALIFRLAERGHKMPGCDNWRAVSMCREIAGLARPTPTDAYLAKFGPVGMNRPKTPPLAQLEPGAGELEVVAEKLCEAYATAHPDDDGLGTSWPHLSDAQRNQWRSAAREALTQAQAKIARLEGDKRDLLARALVAEVKQESAEADAAKVREALGIAKEALQRLAVGTERTFNAETAKQMAASTTAIASDAMNRILSLDHQPEALAAQTERRA